MPRSKVTTAAAALLCTLAAGLAQAAPSAVVSLGDSMSDTGNVHRALQAQDGSNVPVSPPYFEGRFSNGPVAVEHLAQQLDVSLVDLAWGGAYTGRGNLLGSGPALAATGLLDQVDRYLAGPIDAQALHVIWAGGNDLIVRPGSAEAAAANIAQAVSMLYGGGARQFLVPLSLDLATLPMFQGAGEAARLALAQASSTFNQALGEQLGALAGSLTGIELHLFDTAAVVGRLQAGGLNGQAACVTGDFWNVQAVCAAPQQHLFWDGTHLSAIAHAELGGVMASAVPEPASAWLLALGLAGAVFVRARQHLGRPVSLSLSPPSSSRPAA